MGDVAAYFDERASSWEQMEANTKSPVQAAAAIMAGVGAESRVLDLGCGLGVMIPVYQQLEIAHVTGVDISARMVELATQRWRNYPQAAFIAADAAQLDFDGDFDSVVIYNAYPHFMNRDELVYACHRALAPNGRFVVAHGTGKERINSHHEAAAAGVSLGLRSAREESAAWSQLFDIDAVVDTPGFYAFSGSKRAPGLSS